MKNIKALVDKYSYHVTYNPDAEVYVSRCVELPSVTAYGETEEQSMKEIKKAALETLKWMKKEPYPEPYKPEYIQ